MNEYKKQAEAFFDEREKRSTAVREKVVSQTKGVLKYLLIAIVIVAVLQFIFTL